MSSREGATGAQTDVLKTKNDPLTAYTFLLPALLVYGVFMLYPFLSGIVISTLSWNGITRAKFVGLRNYVNLVHDARFLNSLLHNFLYAIGSVVGKIVLGFVFALLLNSKIRGISAYRTLYFTPVVMSFVAVGLLWRWVYNPVFGIMNALIHAIGITKGTVGWLSDPHVALWSIVVVDIWKWTGYHTVIFLAGLQTIPNELFEAADVDGAKPLRKIFSITLPSIRSITVINTTIAVMGAFGVFDLVYVMTGGGPYDATQVLLTYMYLVTFKQQEFGYGTAIVVVLFLIVVAVSIWQQRQMRRDE